MAPTGVRVNTVNPGATDTGLAKGVANESLPGEGDQFSSTGDVWSILLRHSRYPSNNRRLSVRQCSPPQHHTTCIECNPWRRSDRCMGKEIYGHDYLNYNQELWIQLP